MKKLYNRINKEVLKELINNDDQHRITLSFYKYYNLLNPDFFRNHFYILMDDLGVMGRIYVAREGVNAQISVPATQFNEFEDALNTITFLQGVRLNIAIEDDGKSFYKLKIKVRPKIVADGLNDGSFDSSNRGIHLKAPEYNQLAEDPNTIIVDMRNHYESEVGHFENALRPDVETFREALPVVEKMLTDDKDKNIIMYCTGGIRCEKASAYYKHKGFNNVYQIEGGIIEYTRQVKTLGLENKFKGKNFVFDERMGERISSEIISSCHQCGALCDDHVNCKNEACHILFIQCSACSEKYQACCSVKCKDFNTLPQDEQDKLKTTVDFNGTKFGKGRYKAHKKDESLSL